MSEIEPIPGGKLKRDKRRVLYTDAQRKWMEHWIPLVEYRVIAEMAGVSKNYVVKYALERGLKKSPEVKKEILTRNALKTVQSLKDSGYYRHLKGIRRPPEACFEANRKYWQRVREKKELSPLEIVRQRDPQRYEEVCKRRHEHIISTIRKEKQRVMFGQSQKTKLRLRLNPYTKCQSAHRQRALKRGYILYEDCSEEGGERWNIYYDADTERTERFEQNLMKDGFHVKPFTED